MSHKKKLVLLRDRNGTLKFQDFDFGRDIMQFSEMQRTTKKQKKMANSGGLL